MIFKRPLIFYTFTILIFSSLLCFGQGNANTTIYPNWRISVLGELDFGLNFARVEKDDNSAWYQKPGSAISFNPGIGFRYKQKLHVNFGLGLMLDTYNFFSNYAEYNITHLYFQARGNVNYMFPIKGDPWKNLVIGSDFGRAFFGENYKFNAEAQYISRSYAYGPASYFIAPEIGIGRKWNKGQMSLLLTYYHVFRDSPSFSIKIEENTGAQLFGQARGHYLGFKLRANFDFKGHEPIKQRFVEPVNLLESNEMLARDTRAKQVFQSKSAVVKLYIWDDGRIDGDTISVSLNGRFVLSNHGLNKRKKVVKLVLQKGDNSLVFHAHNEGQYPPNTAEIKIKSRWRIRHRNVITTSLKKNESLVIRF